MSVSGSAQVTALLVIFLAVLPWFFRIPSDLNALLAAGSLLLGVVSIVVSVRGRFRPMLGFASTWVSLWMFIPAVYQLTHGVAAWGDLAVMSSGANVSKALLLNLTAQASLLLGYALGAKQMGASVQIDGLRSPRSRREDLRLRTAEASIGDCPTPLPVTQTSYRTTSNVMRVCAGIACLMLPFVARVKGGFGVLFLPRDVQAGFFDAAATTIAKGNVLSALVEIVPFSFSVVGCLLGIRLIKYVGWKKAKKSDRWLLLLSVILTWCYANPIANTRFIALAAFGPMVLYFLYPKSSRAGVCWLTGFSALTFLIYPIASGFSSSVARASSSEGGPRDGFAFLATKDFDGFQQTINAFEYVGAQGHGYGRYFFSALFVVVPRSIWTDKARPASIDVATNHGYGFTNLSLATNAEIYIDFGWIGVVFAFLILGLAYRWLDTRWIDRPQLGPLISYCALAQVGLARGPLGSQMPVVVFVLCILLLDLLMMRRARMDDHRSMDWTGRGIRNVLVW